MKDEWRSTVMNSGEQYVMMDMILINDALILCKQLGYSNYTSYNYLALYVYIVE